ncbi:MAG: hypothetical protein Q9211_003263 [Gyalolechia sp. 1 TL-2023]
MSDMQKERGRSASEGGLGALLAEKFASEGCNVAINYNASEERAKEVAEKIQKAYNCKAIIVKGDQGILADCENTVQKSIDGLGGLDIIVSNAGWTKFTDFGDLDALSEEEWDKVCDGRTSEECDALI